MNRRFRLITNRHLVDKNQLKDRFYIEKDQFTSKIDRFCIEIVIVDSILIVEIQIYVNQRSNSDF